MREYAVLWMRVYREYRGRYMSIKGQYILSKHVCMRGILHERRRKHLVRE